MQNILELFMDRGACIQLYNHIVNNEKLDTTFIECTLIYNYNINDSITYALLFAKASFSKDLEINSYFQKVSLMFFRNAYKLCRSRKQDLTEDFRKIYILKWFSILKTSLNKGGLSYFIKVLCRLPTPLD